MYTLHEEQKFLLVKVTQLVGGRAAMQMYIGLTLKLMLFARSSLSYFKMLIYYLSF